MTGIINVSETKIEFYAELAGNTVTTTKELSDLIMFEDTISKEDLVEDLDVVIADWTTEVVSSGINVDLDMNEVIFYVSLNKYANIEKTKIFEIGELVDEEEIENMSNSEKVEFIQDHSEDALLDWVNETVSTGFNLK